MRIPGLGLIGRLIGKSNDWVMGARDSDSTSIVLYDRTLLWLTMGLAIIGFVMVTSASMPIGQRMANDPFMFAKRDAIYLGLAFALSMVTLRVPMAFWQRYSNVLLLISVVMLFLAGAKLWQFLAIIGSGIFAVCLLIVAEPYRMRRVTSFWNPWADPFGSGYQLTQSLMAFGRGEFWGQGLGNSVQKLEYLPEAHTDFIFSILGEELGYFGVVLSLLMVFFVAFRAMSIGRRALEIDQRFSGFLACSIGVWFSFQALVNVGAAAGMLPTKGLTLPLISYGGSSLLIMSTALVLLLRIDFETRLAKAQAFVRSA